MDITGANATIFLTVPGVFDTPQQLQQFAADDIYDLDQIQSVETQMGVDGFLSGGFVYKPQVQSIMLQADSGSNSLFDVWHSQMKRTRTVIPAYGTILLPAIGLKFTQTIGFLTDYKLPGVKKTITPRRFGITWQDVTPSPAQ